MLEKYFVRPETVDRIRAAWLGPDIERYVVWLSEHGYGPGNVYYRVPLLMAFGEYARARGVVTLEQLPAHVDGFVTGELTRRAARRRDGQVRKRLAQDLRGSIVQMLAVVLPGLDAPAGERQELPFGAEVPGFFEYLEDERGLRSTTIEVYRRDLRRFESYLAETGGRVVHLSPALLSAYVTERASSGLADLTVRSCCGHLRVFLRYAHRAGVLGRDLSTTVDAPQAYRLSTIPRSISQAEVERVLLQVDRSRPSGKRDYAILLLLVVYGLRAREVVALTLDDIDWRRERLRVPERKADHSTAFPLSASVGEAIADYLRRGRTVTADRHVFLRAKAPLGPLSVVAVSHRVTRYLRAAGVEVPRPGSHTLRHTCVQRLVDAEFSLKQIGDFVGHRQASSTEIYANPRILRQTREPGPIPAFE